MIAFYIYEIVSLAWTKLFGKDGALYQPDKCFVRPREGWGDQGVQAQGATTPVLAKVSG